MRRTSRREPPPPFPGMRDLTTLYCGRSALLYRAERESDRAPVVVKLLGRGPGTAGPDEAGLWDRLTPVPGVQPLLSSGVTGAGRAFAVTEYRGEGDYARALAEDGPLAVDEVLTVGRTVARALEGMHELGLLHHAVTPANILRGASGPTLTDFGSTLPLDHPFPPVYYTRAALDHAPPEEVAGSRPTPASDVYRLASTLWTLLAGHAPFAGPGQEETGPREYRSRLLSGTPPE
ncbi:protein kinase, partial [Nocardiopsis tropica]|nr:protein kinase [Nocardiopsis tropica]